ncbi:hypothetical protein IAG44_23520 [Streptomyces roseirectus]|uniref:Uncharacterized protein n=1 Tax=Streptomyces roseirectus TaxID=2768066 RepID=A0A7H0IH23_9ACTN|nr:hypothetical protein [Streptomyces roseirectus]QNP72089.1 hypothetical protein IAG44_23520 [Streptomyces roseirectus]
MSAVTDSYPFAVPVGVEIPERLTGRECEVLRGLAKGESNRVLARRFEASLAAPHHREALAVADNG